MAKYIQCTKCGYMSPAGQACLACEREFSTAKPQQTQAVSVFASGYFRDIAIDPIYIKNRRQLLDETRERGMISPYAEC